MRWSADLGCHDIVVCVMCVDLLIVSVVNVVVHWSSDLGVLGFCCGYVLSCLSVGF